MIYSGGKRNHECLPLADLAEWALSGQTARASLSARHTYKFVPLGTENSEASYTVIHTRIC
jgi:hypothetical protein